MAKAPNGAIIYVGGFELPDLNAAAQRVVANALIFRDLGYRVILVGLTRRAGAAALGPTPEFNIPGLEAWEIPYPTGTAQWLQRIVSIKAVQSIAASVQGQAPLRAIIAYNHPAVSQWRLLALARSLGAKGIADVTEWYADERPARLSAVIKNLDGRLRMNVVNWKMDGLITTSPFLSDHYRRPDLPMVELPTLMDQPPGAAEQATPDGLPKKLFFAGSGFDPVTVARSREGLKERLDLVVERLAGAARRGARFNLDVYGVTAGDYSGVRPDHADLVMELGDSLRFHGRRPREEVRSALRRADYSIFLRSPSRVTLAGFPTKYGESIAFGTPVLTNPLPNVMRHHQEGRTGFLLDIGSEEGSVEGLVDALTRPAAEVQEMKDFCAVSGLFHYTRHQEPVAAFIRELDKR